MINYVKTGHPKWKYRLVNDAHFEIYYIGPFTELYSESGKLLAILSRDHITIKAEYSWDGATWAPDFKRIIPATLVHDLGIQFQSVSEFVKYCANRKQVDRWLLEISARDKFTLRFLYYYATRIYSRFFSPFFREMHARKHQGLSIIIQ
jgi:hypothetical protein